MKQSRSAVDMPNTFRFVTEIELNFLAFCRWREGLNHKLSRSRPQTDHYATKLLTNVIKNNVIPSVVTNSPYM